jgi:hypothetical protein
LTDAAASTGREFRIRPILRRSWSIYAANFLAFTLVAIVIVLPHELGGDPQTTFGAAQTFVAAIVGVILQFVGQAVILYGAFQSSRAHEHLHVRVAWARELAARLAAGQKDPVTRPN